MSTLCLGGWLAHLSLRPFDLTLDPVDILMRLDEGRLATTASSVAHLAAFGLLGVLLAVRRSRRLGDAIAIGAGFAISLELAQAFARTRHARPFDLLIDVLALALGAALCRSGRRAIRRSLMLHSVIVGRLALAAASTLAAVATAAGFGGTSLRSFDPRFPITVGSEADGTRRFGGVIDELEITAVAGADADARTASLDPSDGPSATRAMIATDAFSIAVRCAPAAAEQWGPARIVTCSAGPWRRNWTVAQRGDALEVRVRCACTGWNGADHAQRWPGVFADGKAHRLRLSYACGNLSLRVDGAPRGGVRSLLEEARPDRALSAAPEPVLGVLLAWPLGAFAAVVGASRRRRTALALCGAAPAVAVELFGAATADVAIRGTALTCGALAALAAVLAGSLSPRHRFSRSRRATEGMEVEGVRADRRGYPAPPSRPRYP